MVDEILALGETSGGLHTVFRAPNPNHSAKLRSVPSDGDIVYPLIIRLQYRRVIIPRRVHAR
jgi:hypothetical protein